MSLLYTKLANLITAFRFLFGILLVPLFSFDTQTTRILLFATALAIFISDIIDGIVGTVFDLMIDNLVITTSAVCLLWKEIVPAWISFPVIWTRSLMTLVRMLTLARGEPFAGPRRSTRTKGFVYGLGFVYLVGVKSLNDFIEVPYQSATTKAVIAIIAVSTVVAFCDFFVVNRRTLITLFVK